MFGAKHAHKQIVEKHGLDCRSESGAISRKALPAPAHARRGRGRPGYTLRLLRDAGVGAENARLRTRIGSINVPAGPIHWRPRPQSGYNPKSYVLYKT